MTGYSISQKLTLILTILLLTSCGQPITPAVRAVQPLDSQATQAALSVLTEIARPTRTLTPAPTLPPTETPVPPTATPLVSATPAQPVVRVTAQPGLEFYANPDIRVYLFQIDPAVWEKDPSEQTSNLVHTKISGCRIDNVPPHGLGKPRQLLWQDFGRFRWQILDYGAYAFAAPAVPALNDSPAENQTIFLDLEGYNNRTCRAAQEDVLANLITRREAYGEISMSPFRSPTPRPALEGYDCPDSPPARLRIGDEVSVITNGLWLRSEPRADTSTKVRQFLRYAPVMIHVIGGPVCEKFTYWQVEVSEFGEGGDTLQGWLAEGDLQEYYIVPVK